MKNIFNLITNAIIQFLGVFLRIVLRAQYFTCWHAVFCVDQISNFMVINWAQKGLLLAKIAKLSPNFS